MRCVLVNRLRFFIYSAGVGKGGGLDGAAEACLSLGIPFIVVVRPHTLVAKGAVKVGVVWVVVEGWLFGRVDGCHYGRKCKER